MPKTYTSWDLPAIRAALDREEWEHDPGNDMERRAIGLGSTFSLTPSGKFYMPFACGNLADCPVCGGTGKVALTIKRRVARKWKNESRRRRRLWVQRFGSPSEWPAHIHRASDELNRKYMRLDPVCPRCGGLGSHEAFDDERWTEETERLFKTIGAALESSEGDSTYLLAVEYREPDDTAYAS